MNRELFKKQRKTQNVFTVIFIFLFVNLVSSQIEEDSIQKDYRTRLFGLSQSVKRIIKEAKESGDFDSSYKHLDSLASYPIENAFAYKVAVDELINVNIDRAYLFAWRRIYRDVWKPGNEAFLFNIGVTACTIGADESLRTVSDLDYDLAIECFKRVIEITDEPRNVPVNYKLMSGSYYFKGDSDKGKEAMLKAIESLPPGTPKAEREEYIQQLKWFEKEYGN